MKSRQGELYKGMRIVIVEDEPNTRNGIIKIIEKYTPHEVIAGESDGEAGLE